MQLNPKALAAPTRLQRRKITFKLADDISAAPATAQLHNNLRPRIAAISLTNVTENLHYVKSLKIKVDLMNANLLKTISNDVVKTYINKAPSIADEIRL